MLSWFLQLLVFEKDREAALLEGKQLYLCQLYYSAKKQGAGHNWKKKIFENLGAPQEPFVILHHEKSRLDLPGAVGGANRRDFVGSRPW